MVLERARPENYVSETEGLVTVEVAALEHLIQQIYAAGLLMARATRSQTTIDVRQAVSECLDGLVQSISSMVLRSRMGPADLQSIADRIASAAHEVAEFAQSMNDGAGMLLSEATQSLHHALVALGEANEYLTLRASDVRN